VNVLGHAHVARATGVDAAAELLGAVLPDLASMAGFRLERDGLPAPVAAGVRGHLAADAAFHADRTFMTGSSALGRDAAERAGLSRGAARAVGHVGWELLLDGTLLDGRAAEDYRRALAVAEEATGGVPARDRARWRGLLAHRPRLGWPPYDDPAWVAERLHGMLARRPRLGFPADRLDDLTVVLADHVPRIAEAGPGVLAATAASVGEALGNP
jgi:hypothetical protein